MSTGQAHAATLALTQYVDPFIGTDDGTSPEPLPGGAGGSTYPGATYPFGMAQFSPDTPTASPSGYRRSDTKIEQFSMTHFNGAGCATNESIQIMPTTTASLGSANSPGTNWANYASTKSAESAKPGFYQATLGDSTKVELSATQRTGAARMTFPSSTTARILVNASGKATTGGAQASTTVSGTEVSGWTTSGDFCTPLGQSPNQFRVFFVMKFDRTPTAFGTWHGSTVNNATSGQLTSAGTDSGGYVTFDTSSNRAVNVKVGISFVSVEGARQNLAQEQSATSTFDSVKTAADTAWNTRLNSIQATGGSTSDLQKFYTALYRVMQNPNVASDLGYTVGASTVGRRYRGFDGQVHTVPTDMAAVYQNFSGWDTYRSWAALASLVAPDAMKDVVKSMLLDGADGGLLPSWSQQSTETYTMPGDPGPIVVASAYAFGVRGFDTSAALALMKKNASGASYNSQQPDSATGETVSLFAAKPVRDERYKYQQYGYIPSKPSTTLEYAASDFAIAQFAQALNDGSSSTFMQGAQSWAKTFNPTAGFIQARYSDGSWPSALDPADHDGFTEGNPSQYTWAVPYNYQSLFDGMGGRAAAVKRLDQHFAQLNSGISKPYYYMGNEAGHGVPWAYNFAASPANTSAVVRRLMNLYTTGAGGLPGNDDLGSTSAWYVWAAMGMYPATPGADTLALHGPLFPSILIQRPGGNIQINGTGAGPSAPYVQSVSVKGTPTSHNFIQYRDIAAGGTINFAMGASPSTWGTASGDVPPSFTSGFTTANPQPAAAPVLGTNLAQGKTATGSAPCTTNEGPAKAIDGSLDSRWCSTATSGYLQVDLGAPAAVSSVVVNHAALGGASTASNTKAFTIQTSTDGTNFTTVAVVSGSKASRTYHPLAAPVTVRYIKLVNNQPAGTAVVINELEVDSPQAGSPIPIVGSNGYCLALAYTVVAAVGDCGTAPATWQAFADGTVHSAGQCLSEFNEVRIRDINGIMRNTATLATCDGSDYQVWTPQPGGTVLNKGLGLCLTESPPGITNNNLYLGDCATATRLIWPKPA
ncbi:GH92 family glycosyl hydrolase [Kitasatospora sp. NPDC088346]|uniref:GH92 family glycosyl hydrolase n=1 Tax=Kitasatospora sp. NPDC088346 TaxID=3364073 RepID=UPI0038231F85